MEHTKKWNIDPNTFRDKKKSDMFSKCYRDARAQMDLRTKGHEVFSRVSHMQNLFDKRDGAFSEGSSQAIKRKVRSNAIQRVPDGEIISQYDKNSIEQVELEYLFKKKVLTSEYDGKDMLKNIWNAFSYAWDYGHACIRTGFERDNDGDIRISWKQIQWNDVLCAPDTDYIEDADWYLVREYLSYSDLREIIDEDGNCLDPTYSEDVVKWVLDERPKSAQEPNSHALADMRNAVTKTDSIVVYTKYKRGASEFETYCPVAEAVIRTVANEDPRKDVPLHFMILEPDPEFPLGCSSVVYTMAQQQFADAFQTAAYQSMLLAINPPLQVFGNLTNAHIKMKPKSIWNMGTNPNNRVEKFPVETTTLTQYGSTLNNISANMQRNLNVTESTIATDANVPGYSATPQGVEQQQRDKTTTFNQYQKRVEIFFGEWANHALRSYINSMGGKIKLTVDEETRRKIWDIESSMSSTDEFGQPMVESIIDGNKIEVDFDLLSSDLLEFSVRVGSLIESEQDVQRRQIQEMTVSISQMMGNLSEANRSVFEDVLMQLIARQCELSNLDLAVQTSTKINDQLMQEAMEATMQQVMQQQQQIDQLQQQVAPQQPMAEGAPIESGMEGEMPPMPSEEAIAPQPAEVSAEFPEPVGGLA